jgi:hypothetical protein
MIHILCVRVFVALFMLIYSTGLLINLGPLLYHYADMDSEVSIDLSYEEIKAALPYLGLRMVVRTHVPKEPSA